MRLTAPLLAVVPAVVLAAAGAVPQSMEAVVQRGVGGPEVMKLEHLSVPRPAANQVLVQVYAAGVNPVDWKTRTGNPRVGGLADATRPGATGGPGESKSPAAPAGPATQATGGAAPKIPGGEVAGVVAAVGDAVTQWHVGDAVYGRARAGGYAQYVVADTDVIAAKPKRLTFAQAAGLPVGGLTALSSLNTAGVHSGQTLVIIGAAGGVGSATVQIAKARGVKVIAIASSRHNAYLKQMGADGIVNYDKGNPAEKIGNADAVIDLVDGPAAAALSYVKRGGKVILPTGYLPLEQCAAAGVVCAEPDKSQPPSAAEVYAQLNRFVDAGQLTVKVQQTLPLAQAGQAQELDHAGHAEGKIILVTTAAANQS